MAWRPIGGVLGIAVLAASTACNAGQPSQGAPSAPPILDAVTFRPEQVILPPEEFPLNGYSVDMDERAGAQGWSRSWSGPGAFPWVRVDVTVLSLSERSYASIAATACDQRTFTPPALRTAEVTAPVVGDGAKACSYDFQDAPAGSLVYTTGTRNVLVAVGIWRGATTVASAAAFAASLADYQLWIIDRVAPLTNAALRATPTVLLPSSPATAHQATPQPTVGPEQTSAAAATTTGSAVSGAGTVGNEPATVTNPIGNVPMGYWWPRTGAGGSAPGASCGKEFLSLSDSTAPGPKAIYVNGQFINVGHAYLSPVAPGSYNVVIRDATGKVSNSFVATVRQCSGYTYING